MEPSELSETQQKIDSAIQATSVSGKPFATAADIAEYTNLSKRTVLNNVDAVVHKRDNIQKETVGQANVYYTKQNRFDEIWNEHTESITRLHLTRSPAVYAELRNTPGDSEFDFEVHWYTADATELDGYDPNPTEMGQVLEGYSAEPVAIKFFDPDKAYENSVTEEEEE